MINFFKPKPQLTKNNHFEYGFTEDNLNLFKIKLGGLTRKHLTGFEEAVLSAKLIFKNSQNQSQKISLCLSGGIDSEAMLQAFAAAQVDFNICILKFENNLNDFDISTNIKICVNLNLEYKLIELDVIRFFESGDYLSYGHKYRCQSPQLAVHLWLLDQIDGLPVLGGNPFIKSNVNGRSFFIGLPGDLHCTYFRYFNINNREGVPWFFIYSPELCASFFKLPTSQKLHKISIQPGQYTYLHKCQLYIEAGFKVQPRTDKYTGFESLRDIYDKKLATLNGEGFDRSFRKPLEDLNPFPEQYRQLVPAEYFK